MKKLMFLALLLSFVQFLWAQDPVKNHPESVCPLGGVHYFSNTTAGHIHAIQADGQKVDFALDVGKVLGLAAHENKLYAAVNREDGGHVLGFLPPSKELVFDLHIPEAKQLNDIAISAGGILYVTDRVADRIYAVDLEKADYTSLADGEIKTPNGIWFDASLKRLLICNTVEASSIYSLDLESGKVTELLATGKPHLDGLAMDHSGNIYVTSWSVDWKGSQLIRYSPIFEEWVMQENENGMADLYLYPTEDKIGLANWYTNRITNVHWPDGKAVETPVGNP